MKYDNVRPLMKSGDLVATTHKSWKSFYDLQVQAVRVGTQSEYCHVGILWSIGGRMFVLESVTPLIRIVPLSNFVKEGFYWIPSTVDMTYREMEFALSKVAVGKYSKWQAILAQLRKLKIGHDDLWECAEYVIACRKMSGMDCGDKATPSAVVQYVIEHYDTSVRFVSE